MYGELFLRKTESVDVGKARRGIMTYPVSALNESGDPPLHPPYSPLYLGTPVSFPPYKKRAQNYS